MSATEAWDSLQRALRASEPSCQGDERFTDDSTPASALSSICRACPIFSECADYARVAPTGSVYGVWAGLVRRAPRRYRNRSRALTDVQVAMIGQLRDDGLSIAAIANQVGVGTTTVQRYLRRLADAS